MPLFQKVSSRAFLQFRLTPDEAYRLLSIFKETSVAAIHEDTAELRVRAWLGIQTI